MVELGNVSHAIAVHTLVVPDENVYNATASTKSEHVMPDHLHMPLRALSWTRTNMAKLTQTLLTP